MIKKGLLIIFAAIIVASIVKGKPSGSSNKKAQGPTEADIQAMRTVRLNGYKCDTFSAGRASMFENSYQIVCNDYRYSYLIKDVGGRWVVEVE